MYFPGLVALVLTSLFALVMGFIEAPLVMVAMFVLGCAANVLFLKKTKWASMPLKIVACVLWVFATRWAIVPLLVSIPYILYHHKRVWEEEPECNPVTR